MIPTAFVTLLLVSASPSVSPDRGPSSSAPIHAPRGPHHRGLGRAPVASRGEIRIDLVARSDAYGTRARRRFAAYLRLRLLEMREAGLERAAAVVERQLPVDALVPPLRDGPPGPP